MGTAQSGLIMFPLKGDLPPQINSTYSPSIRHPFVRLTPERYPPNALLACSTESSSNTWE